MLVERTLKEDGGHGMLEFTMPEAVVMVEGKLIGSFPLSFTDIHFIGHSEAVRKTKPNFVSSNIPIVQFDTKPTQS